METSINRLLSISSDEIAPFVTAPDHFREYLGKWKHLGTELAELLYLRNGFWAYESCLLVRPFANDNSPLGIVEWNDERTWKSSYDQSPDEALLFAEDVFGSQYCILDGQICRFDPETAEFDNVATTLEGWANTILTDSEYMTGYPLGHSWQLHHEVLHPGSRLLPIQPFVLGGEYDSRNLYVSKDVEGMRSRAAIANQIRDVPDGGHVVIDVSK